ncbi:MAG: ADP-ribosylglycohydrolase family protein [Lachnospiraceae bacterium]|jgi:ADP-ribosylglycohydrolase|nr:ADP-ribosylglycohydrolase family protein [Lachnospiraceae bacterium]
MKIQADYTKTRMDALYAVHLQDEYRQSVAEGKDIEEYQALFCAVDRMPLDEHKAAMADVLSEIVLNAPMKEGYAYEEPSDLEGIRRLRPGKDAACGCGNKALEETPGLEGASRNAAEGVSESSGKGAGKWDEEALRDKIHGAWMGRICGCLLGKTVEGIRTDELIPLLEQSGNYPMHRYIESGDVTPYMRENYRFFKERQQVFFADQVSFMPFDDDMNYVVMAQKLIEKYGRSFTPYDMSQEWLRLQPMTSYFTAEAVAYRNFSLGIQPPDSAVYQNPFREWIGAQIRGDYFGYINPGNPQAAAELAWRDASISHVKNGIYGEMFVAAMLAEAAVKEDLEEIIRGGMAQIPQTSRLYEHLEKVIGWYNSGISEKECFDRIHEEWDEHTLYGWCHTISNAMIVAASLLYGRGDYGKSICLAVQTGFDTDCNGATVGSVLGIRGGALSIPEEWTRPIHETLETTIFGMDKAAVKDLADMTMRHIQGR